MAERTRFEGIEGQSKNSFRQSGCSIKNGQCVPKCSELTEEELNKGLQCEIGKELHSMRINLYYLIH